MSDDFFPCDRQYVNLLLKVCFCHSSTPGYTISGFPSRFPAATRWRAGSCYERTTTASLYSLQPEDTTNNETVRLKSFILYISFLFLLLPGLTAQSQDFRVSGKLLGENGDPIAFASIRVKESHTGTTSRADGAYELLLNKGNYHLEVSIVGFKSREIQIAVQEHTNQDIILEQESKNLSEVIVTAKVRDRAEDIMRKVIRRKDSIQSAAGAHAYNVYIKATLLDSSRYAESQATNIEHKDANTRTMAEIFSKVDIGAENQLKEKRLAVRGKLNTRMFYLSATEGNFNFYNNLVNVPSVSATPFLSPVSVAGLTAYRFKTIRTERRGKHKIYTFSVKPLQVTNATVEGELTVSDSASVVLHTRFRFPSYHLQEFDFFEVEQDYTFSGNKAWMLSRQKFTYAVKTRKQVYAGETIATYSDYVFNRHFEKRHFNAELSATDNAAYERDSTYWHGVRTQALTAKEAKMVRQEDSLLRHARSERYLDSMDRVVNRVTWQKMGLFGQSLINHKKERTWHFSPLVSMYNPFAFGGGRIHLSAFHSKTFSSRKYFDVNADVSYGIRNNDVNGAVVFYRKYNPFNQGFYALSAGREFSFINEGDAWINMIRRNNFYLNNYIGVGHGLEIINGLQVTTDLQLAFRKSVDNYKTGKLADSLFENVLENNQAVSFQPYNALYGKLRMQYTPGQKYRREPKEKVLLGSKWPTIFLQWEKGIPGVAGSKVDFDYLELGIEQSLRLGLIGVSRYTLKTGEYMNEKDLRFIDYKIQRRGDPLLFMNPYKSFQALDSTFPVFNRFFEAHLFHEFNGLFINKIPLLKKLRLREIGGAGFLLAPERNLRYAELYVGIERAFTSPFNPLDKFKLGVYVVGSAANHLKDPVQFKVGFTTWDKRRKRWF
jgi:hypothetical protein